MIQGKIHFTRCASNVWVYASFDAETSGRCAAIRGPPTREKGFLTRQLEFESAMSYIHAENTPKLEIQKLWTAPVKGESCYRQVSEGFTR
jgi:hypothetical protein